MPTARRTNTFTESVIREMTRIANEHGALNLAQGMPDFPMPQPLKDAACMAIQANINQYAITWGTPSLRLAIAAKYRRWYDMNVDSERNVTVTCGATEAMAAVFLALINPGDEVIVFEPFYENYGPDAILAEAQPRFLGLREPDWVYDPAELDAAFLPFLDREVDRVDPIERAALRIAAYELRERPDVPYRVVINEAVETTKRFGADHGHTYVNARLDKLAAPLRSAGSGTPR